MSARRFCSIWFRRLITDHYIRRQPALQNEPFVFCARERNRDVITFASAAAFAAGIRPGLPLSDARMLLPGIPIIPGNPDPDRLLHSIALRLIRYSPIVATDPPDGLLIEITGCTHLWGGEAAYYKDIMDCLQTAGYDARTAIADTPGAARAFARYLKRPLIVPPGEHTSYLPQLPPTALCLPASTVDRLRSLGMTRIQHLLDQPRTTLTPRFGNELLQRLDQVFGNSEEHLISVVPPVPYRERLPCLDPVVTPGGIEYALTRLLEMLCGRLQREAKGLRNARFDCHRIDGKVMSLTVSTTRPTCSARHLFQLFETKIPQIEPDLGIELFTLEAPVVEEAPPGQEALWGGPANTDLTELLDRLAVKTGMNAITRYVPAEHHLPERSCSRLPLDQPVSVHQWPTDPRPIHLFDTPEPITVTAPIPDYPPMSFRHRNTLHKVVAAAGPTRIENEWWIDNARARDYYTVEDEQGARYWIFRSGHYEDPGAVRWFLHGLFA